MKHNCNVCAMAVSHSADVQFEQTYKVGTPASNRWKHRRKPSSRPVVSCWPLNLSKQKATEWAVIFHDVTGTRSLNHKAAAVAHRYSCGR